MSDWSLNYHQILEYRLIGMTMLVGAFGLSIALGRTLYAASQRLVSKTLFGIPICQRHKP